jgi:uncharacterized protein (DUF2164 family)
MRNLYFIVEGETEEEFVKRLLIPYLYNQGLNGHMQPIMVHMSGGGHGHSNVEHFLNTIEPVLYYNGEPVITSLLDFFRFPRQQQAFAACGVHGPAAAQVACLQQALFVAVQRIRPYARFLPYIQLHEFEALLFADEVGYELHATGIQAGVAAVINDYPSPEDINSRPENAPSKRLASIFQAHGQRYRKAADAVDIIELIGMERLRQRCPLFGQWVEQLITAVQI